MAVFTTISNALSDAACLIADWATADDHARAAKHLHSQARRESLLARAALRALLSHATGQKDWVLQSNARGKLQCFTKAGTEGPHISLSHTRGRVACAISEEAPVGIDVERWRPRDYNALADYAFGPCEREAVKNGAAVAFYRIWALREAMAKATGDGLFAHIDGKDCIMTEDKNTQAVWDFFYHMPEADCSLAMALHNRNDERRSPPIWTEITIPIITAPPISEKA